MTVVAGQPSMELLVGAVQFTICDGTRSTMWLLNAVLLHAGWTGLGLNSPFIDDRGDGLASAGVTVGWTGHRHPRWHDAGSWHGLREPTACCRGHRHDRTWRQWCLHGTRGWVGNRLSRDRLLRSPRLWIDRRSIGRCVGVRTLAVMGTA